MEQTPAEILQIVLEKFINSLTEDDITHISISIIGPESIFLPHLQRQVVSSGNGQSVIQHLQPPTLIPADIQLRYDDRKK